LISRPDEGIYSITYTDLGDITYYMSREGNEENVMFDSTDNKGLDNKVLWYVKHVTDKSDEITLNRIHQTEDMVCKNDTSNYIKCSSGGTVSKFKTVPHSITPDLYLLKLVTSTGNKFCRNTSSILGRKMICDNMYDTTYLKFIPEKYLFVKSKNLSDQYNITGGDYTNISLDECKYRCDVSPVCKGFNVNYVDDSNTTVNCTLKSENRIDYLNDSQDKNFAYKGTYFPEVKPVNTLITCKENDPNPNGMYTYKIIGDESENVTVGHIQAYASLTALQSYYPSPDDWNNVSSIDCKNRIDTGSIYQTFNQNCDGKWETTDTNYDQCLWSRKYVVSQEKRGDGTPCDYEDGTEEKNKPLTSDEIRDPIPESQRQKCKSQYDYDCGSTYVYETINTDEVKRQACNNGVKASAPNGTKTLQCSRKSCPSSSSSSGFGR